MFYNRHLKILGLLYLRPPELAGPAEAGGATNCVVEVAGRRAVSSVGGRWRCPGGGGGGGGVEETGRKREKGADLVPLALDQTVKTVTHGKKRNPSLQTVARKA